MKINLLFEDIENNVNFKDCNDINPSGIRRFWVSPLLNAALIYYSYYPENKKIDLLSLFGDLTGVDNYIIMSAVNHSPDDWTGYDPRVESLFKHLNEKYLNDLRLGNALLMLDSSFEGYHTSWLFDWFHKECSNWGISPKQIIYVSGNMIVNDIYQIWCDENNITDRMKCIGYSHFELDVAMTVKNKIKDGEPLPSFEENFVYKFENLRNIKTYACQNKRIRRQRIWFYKYLHDSGLLPYGLVSMNNFDETEYDWDGAYITPLEVRKLNENLPLLIYNKRNDELDDNYYIRRFNDQVCKDTFITVVSEAQCSDRDQTMFISEKTFKTIGCTHPFIVMGNKNTMSKLREMGYKTFEGHLDEGYDPLPTHERLQRIIKTLYQINNIHDKMSWYLNMKEIVKHNHQNLLSKLDRVPDAFQEIIDYYMEMFNKNKII